jgi:hypothetical protein
MTRAVGSILNPKQDNSDSTQAMDMTLAIGSIRTPQRTITPTPESSPFYNSPLRGTDPRSPTQQAEIIRSPLSTGISGTPKRTPSRGLLALDLLTGKPLTPLSRRKTDPRTPTLGSPSAAQRLKNRTSLGGIEEFNTSKETRRVSLGRASWSMKEFGQIEKPEEVGIRNLIAQMTPKKSVPSRSMSPLKQDVNPHYHGISKDRYSNMRPPVVKQRI